MIATDTMNIRVTQVSKSRIAEVDWQNLGFGLIHSDHMFVADYKDGQWHNLSILPYGNFEVSPAMSALHYGQSIFEGMKAYRFPDGSVNLFRPLDNLKRLNASAERMAMPGVPEELFMESLLQLVRLDEKWVPKDSGNSLYIRPLLFATEDHIGVKISDTYRLIIMTSPVAAYYSKPLKVMVETKYTRAVPGGVGFAKTAGNYGRSHYPTKLAQQKGYNQVIWTDGVEHKYLEESGTMNVMCMIGDTLITPGLHDTILAGITRDSVIKVAGDLGIKVEEKKLSVDDLVQAHKAGTLKEIFGAGTAATIAPISLFGYNGKDYELPAINEQSTGSKLMKALDDIRTGKSPDKHGWMQKV